VLAGVEAELLQEAGVVGFEPLFFNLAVGDQIQVGAREDSVFASGTPWNSPTLLGPVAVADSDHVALRYDYLRAGASSGSSGRNGGLILVAPVGSDSVPVLPGLSLFSRAEGQGFDWPLNQWPEGQLIIALSSSPSVDRRVYRAVISAGRPHRTAPTSSR
jgi:hypothetical protein